MITGVHAIVFTKDPPGVRAFFRDVLALPSVDAGGGWPIFALPPAELAVHPSDADGHQQLYLMCDDIETTVRELEGKGVEFTTAITDVGWGLMTRLRLPDGSELPLYEPKHPSPLEPGGRASP
ncbi:MAG: VOC family protein [Solirubrobacteraceae bacterium]